MPSYQLKLSSSDLASRQAAAELRAVLEQHVRTGKRVSVDFSNVLSVSESYADELFGVLALRYGLAWLSENVIIQHVDPLVFRAIAGAIRQRLTSTKPDIPNIALLSARKVLERRHSKV